MNHNHKQRETEDGYFVTLSELVYEALWRYYNPEWSEAMPHQTTASVVPESVRIWKKEYNCKHYCNSLNDIQRYKLSVMVQKSM